MSDKAKIIDALFETGRSCACDTPCSTCEQRLNGCKYYDAYSVKADALMRNGVSILPCKIGDTAYALCNKLGTYRIAEGKITEMHYEGKEMRLVVTVYHLASSILGDRIFLTREEAEQKLQQMHHGCEV